MGTYTRFLTWNKSCVILHILRPKTPPPPPRPQMSGGGQKTVDVKSSRTRYRGLGRKKSRPCNMNCGPPCACCSSCEMKTSCRSVCSVHDAFNLVLPRTPCVCIDRRVAVDGCRFSWRSSIWYVRVCCRNANDDLMPACSSGYTIWFRTFEEASAGHGKFVVVPRAVCVVYCVVSGRLPLCRAAAHKNRLRAEIMYLRPLCAFHDRR